MKRKSRKGMLKASLPNEGSYELAKEVVRDYVQRNFVDKGMYVDWAIYDSENDKGQRNLHIHVLLTMRPLTDNRAEGNGERKKFNVNFIVNTSVFLYNGGIAEVIYITYPATDFKKQSG